MERKRQRNGLHYPARSLRRSPAADRNSSGEGLVRITSRTRPPRKGLDLSICTLNCRGLSRDERLDYLLREKNTRACDILGVWETRLKKEKHMTSRDGSTILLGTGTGRSNVGGVVFIINSKWSKSIISNEIRPLRNA
ncbi:hypothetical protein AB6A40_009204 [Gnathostoma spinigerum]|uniref:Uncharacterized protein n=1 Tax=Gnathostoma spinigerum TaxID=75299 RepID=A0ABD6ESH1_9BILA